MGPIGLTFQKSSKYRFKKSDDHFKCLNSQFVIVMDVIDGLKAIEGSYLYDRVTVSISVIKRAIDLYGCVLGYEWGTKNIKLSSYISMCIMQVCD